MRRDFFLGPLKSSVTYWAGLAAQIGKSFLLVFSLSKLSPQSTLAIHSYPLEGLREENKFKFFFVKICGNFCDFTSHRLFLPCRVFCTACISMLRVLLISWRSLYMFGLASRPSSAEKCCSSSSGAS